jgi:starch phosphorylase
MSLREHSHRHDIEGFDLLEELALDLIWSWNRSADKIWAELDKDLWLLTRNPWVILQTISKEKLEKTLADPAFLKIIKDLLALSKKKNESPAWFQIKHANSPLTCVAYFSMEFMLSEALPIYSGGLGNVAGDQLKAANDLGVPVVGIGLLYSQGYFRQMIDNDGNQHALYPFNSPEQLPIVPLRTNNGEWLHVELAFPGWSIRLRIWEVKIGRIKLYLLDSNDASNVPIHRGITSELYGGDPELRLKQEIVLGIGGWKLLEALNIKPEVCHLNEGHAAFAILERARAFMRDNQVSFDEALAATRSGNLFTTHTAVAAGFDRFSRFLIEEYLGKYAKQALGIELDDLMDLGKVNPNDDWFNMACLAIRGSHAVNGVSKLHGEVSRCIFEPFFPRWPADEVPVGYVTNGIHTSSWDSEMADDLWTEFCGKERWLGEMEDIEKDFRKVSDKRLWDMRNAGRKEMIENGRGRLVRILQARGAPEEEIADAKKLYDFNTLTLGFARRFATYKRPNMLLHDPERLLRILMNPDRPVQLVLSGKAHPADGGGQAMIKQWMQFIRRPGVRRHVAFIPDYDMLITVRLVKGVDLWINTPRRPWEACGTSGMKVLVNGGVNLSELDGWWAEAYCPEVGWALGDGQEHGNDPAWDAKEANDLYNLLENEIVPAFYNRNKEGLPTVWLAKVRESMARLTPTYSANRAVREYTENYYLHGAESYRKRSANQGEIGKQIAAWQKALKQHWGQLQFMEQKTETRDGKHHFTYSIYLDGLDPESVKVQLYANGLNGNSFFLQDLERDSKQKEHIYLYRTSVPASRPATDFTARIIPYFPEVHVPLAASQILWQK